METPVEQTLVPQVQKKKTNHIHVCVRMKPTCEQVCGNATPCISLPSVWQIINQRTISDKTGRENFTFDKVFDETCPTESLFKAELR